MGFFNDKQVEAFETGRYICSECGAVMEFEDKWEDVLICPECGHSIDSDRYGCESDEEYEALYPTEEEVLGYSKGLLQIGSIFETAFTDNFNFCWSHRSCCDYNHVGQGNTQSNEAFRRGRSSERRRT